MASTITIPSTSASDTLFSGISDVFSDLARSRENEYQRKRQEEADARAAAYHAQRMRDLDLDITEKERVAGNILSDEDLVRNLMTSQGKAYYGPGLNKPFGEGGGMFPVKADPTFAEQTEAAANVSRGVSATTSQNLKRYYETVINIEKNKRAALKDGQDLRTATANADEAVREAAYNLRIEPFVAQKVMAQADKAVSDAESAALSFEQDQTTASALNRQRRLEDYASGAYKVPLKTLATEESDAGPNFRAPTIEEQDFARKELIRKGHADEYKDLQYGALGLADVASGRRNWDTSLDKSGYTTSQANTLAETFAPQFATQFSDDDNVTRRESEQMSNYALAAARQIFNNPDIQLPSGTKAIDLYNQILSQRDLYAKDTYPNIVGINYEPITEVATIIKNWQNLNNPETEQQLRVRLTNQARSQFPTATPTQIEATVNARIQQLGG